MFNKYRKRFHALTTQAELLDRKILQCEVDKLLGRNVDAVYFKGLRQKRIMVSNQIRVTYDHMAANRKHW